jgi:hypothetical protein
MAVMSFHERSSSQPPLATWLDAPGEQSPSEDKKAQAVAKLLEHGVLSHVFGQHGEYKVRTTMTTRQVWQYRCSVLHHGKAIKRAFFPITVERRPPTPFSGTRLPNHEDIRLGFAREAVDIHFTRCAALQEYLMLAVLYDQPRKHVGRWYALLFPMVGIAALAAYGFWTQPFRVDVRQPTANPSVMVSEQSTGRGPKAVPLPASSPTASTKAVDEQSRPIDPGKPAGSSKDISVTDVLALQVPQEKVASPIRAFFAGGGASDIQEGDLLRVNGWLQRVSRGSDASYHLYVSPSRQAKTQVLMASVPPPTLAQDFPEQAAQLQTVRTFIRQQLLRGQEPSSRASVMQRPIFVQLTGQLALPTGPPVARARRKGASDAPPHWGIRPILEVQFATPPAFSDTTPPS